MNLLPSRYKHDFLQKTTMQIYDIRLPNINMSSIPQQLVNLAAKNLQLVQTKDFPNVLRYIIEKDIKQYTEELKLIKNGLKISVEIKSKSLNTYLTILTLQTMCCLYFKDITNEYKTFFKILNKIISIIITLDTDLEQYIITNFEICYMNITGSPIFYEFSTFINIHLSSVLQLPDHILPIHLHYISNLCNLIVKNPNFDYTNIDVSLVFGITQHFLKCKPSNANRGLVQNLLNKFLQILSNFIAISMSSNPSDATLGLVRSLIIFTFILTFQYDADHMLIIPDFIDLYIESPPIDAIISGNYLVDEDLHLKEKIKPKFNDLIITKYQNIHMLFSNIKILQPSETKNFLHMMSIPNRNLIANYLVLFFLLLESAEFDNDMLNYICSTDILYSTTIWNPNITLFDKFSSDIIIFRMEILKFINNTVYKLNKAIAKEMICKILVKCSNSSKLFVEIAYLLAKITNSGHKRSLLAKLIQSEKMDVSLTSIIGLQLKVGFKDDDEIVMTTMIKILYNSIDQIRKLPEVSLGADPPFHNAMLDLLENPKYSKGISTVLRKCYCNLLLNHSKMNFVFQTVVDRLKLYAEDFKKHEAQINQIENLIISTIANIPPNLYKDLTDTQLIDYLSSYGLEPEATKPVVCSMLSIIYFISFSDQKKAAKLDYNKLAEKILTLEIDKQLFDGILSVISIRRHDFVGIANLDSYPLVHCLLKSTFKETFLNLYLEILKKSYIQCFTSAELGLPIDILNMINENLSEEENQLLTTVFEQITSCACNRPTFYRFMSLINESSSCKMTVDMLHTLMRLISQYTPSYNLLQFQRRGHHIDLPQLQSKFFTQSISFSYRILFSGFIDDNAIELLDLSKPDAKIRMQIILKSYELLVVSNIFDTLSYGSCLAKPIPVNTWIKLFLVITADSVKLYVDGELQTTVEIQIKQIPDYFEKITMFERPPSQKTKEIVCVQFNQLVIQSPISSNVQAAAKIVDIAELAKQPNTLLIYNASILKDENLVNMMYNGLPDAKFKSFYYPMISQFNKVLMASKGVEYVMYLIYKVKDFTGDELHLFIMKMINTVTIMISAAKESQTILFDNGFFEIFADKVSISEFAPTMEIFNSINTLSSNITDDRLKQSLFQWVILNYSIWKRSDVDFKFKILSYWLKYAKTNKDESKYFKVFVTIPSILVIFGDLKENLNAQRIAMFSEIVFHVAEESFKKIKRHMQIYLIIAACKDFIDRPDLILMFLVPFAKAAKNQKCYEVFAENILTASFIVSHPSPLIQTFLIKEVTTCNSTTCCQHLLSYMNLKNHDDLLIPVYRLYVGIEQEMKYEEIIASAESWHFNPYAAPFLLASSFFLSHEMQKIFSQIILGILSNKNNYVSFLSSYNKPITMILFVILIFYFPTKPDAMIMNQLIRCFVSDTNFAHEVLQTLMMISIATNINNRDIQQSIVTQIIKAVDENKIKNQQEVINLIYIYLNEAPKNYESQKQMESYELSCFEIFSKCILFKNYEIIKKPYYLNGVWLDRRLAIKFCRMAASLSDQLDFTSIIFVIASILRTGEFTQDIIGVINLLFAKYESNDLSKLSPIYMYYLKNPQVFAQTPLKKCFLGNDPFKIFELACNTYIEMTPSLFSNNIVNELNAITNEYKDVQLNEFKAFSMDLVVNDFELLYANTLRNAQRIFSKLELQLFYNASPYSDKHRIVNESFFKRRNFFDAFFRPIVLLPNNSFNPHDKGPEITTNIVIQEPMTQRLDIISMIDKVSLWEDKCSRIKITETFPGIFTVYEDEIVFIANIEIVIKGSDIRDVFWAWMDQHPNGIQIFTWTNQSYLFCFKAQENHKFVQNLKKCDMPNIRFFQENPPQQELQRLHITKDWQEKKMSTMEYLMWLNLLSGRSFHSTKFYPIFPFIPFNDENTFELKNKKLFRDLSKNLGTMNKNCLEKLKMQSEALADEFGHTYLHSSLYSNPFSVTYFLVRVEPFATLQIRYQNGTFDVPSRLFRSIPYLFSKIRSDAGFNREMVPELFFNDEPFVNCNKFNFGADADGTPVNDVELPKWATSPIDFTDKLRRMLESSFVSSNINKWIDLIWGVNAFGEGAIKNDNTYSPLIYPNTWQSQDNDKEAVQGALNTIGQVPQQLFTAPHPVRNTSSSYGDRGTLVMSQLDSPVVAFKCFGSSMQSLRIFTVLRNGKMFLLKTSAGHIPLSVSREDRTNLFPIDSKLIAYIDGNQPSFAFISPRSDSPSFFDFEDSSVKKVSSLTPHLDEISCVCAAGKYFVTAGKDTCISLWSVKSLTIINTLIAHNNPILCMTASSAYGIIVSVSINKMIICSLHNLQFIRMVELNFPVGTEPIHVFLTPMMGYIVIVTSKMVFLYTVNGKFASSITLDSEIMTSCAIKTQDFDDKVVVVRANHAVEYYNTPLLEYGGQICKPKELITHIEYSNDLHSIVCSTNSPLLYIIPIGI